MGGTNLDNGGPKNISRTYKQKLLGAATFIELLFFFANVDPPELRKSHFWRAGGLGGSKKNKLFFKTKVIRNDKQRIFRFIAHTFFCTYGRTYVPLYVQTDVPKKIRDVPTNESCPSRKVDGRK